MNAENYAEQLSRVKLMATGDNTWDLSPRDLLALNTVLNRLDTLELVLVERCKASVVPGLVTITAPDGPRGQA